MTGPRVLIVEDEPLIRADLTDVFEGAGYDVLGAKNGDEAEKLLEREPEISAVVTDIDMPGEVDGIWLSWIAYKRDPKIGVVVISGQIKPADGELPENACFQSKPFASEATLHMVQHMITDHGVLAAPG